MTETNAPLAGVIMGSKSDGETRSHAVKVLERFEFPHETRIVFAHRTPTQMAQYAFSAESRGSVDIAETAAANAAQRPAFRQQLQQFRKTEASRVMEDRL